MRVPPGSYLAISHPAADVHAEARAGRRAAERGPWPARSPSAPATEIARFFGGLELVEPGLVSTTQWRSGAGATPGPCPAGPAWPGIP